MRQIGTLASEVLAERFIDYLVTREISATSEEDGDCWIIWVRDENHLDIARGELQKFEADPHAEAYQVQQQAAELRAAELKRRRAAKKNLVEMKGSWNAPITKRAPLVTAIIVACVALAVFGGGWNDNQNTAIGRALMFADPGNPAVVGGDGLANIRAGQVWRLLTPIFLHGGLIHLIFNMFWIYHLGGQLESKLGAARFLAIVVVTGVASNLLQYSLANYNFVGISGVVFGLFGYIWMRIVHDPTSGYRLSQQTIVIILIFFGIGFTGLLDIGGHGIANWAHAGGLGAGIILGLLPEWLSSKRRPAA